MTTPTAHLFYDINGAVALISTYQADVDLARKEGMDVFVDAEPVDILEEVAPRNLSTVIDDTTWQQLGPALLATVCNCTVQGRDTAMPLTLPDLPGAILAQRLNTLEKIFDPSLDLSAYLKLSELAMAYEYNREPAPEFFTGSATKVGWQTIYTVDPARLDASVQAQQEVVNEMAADSGITLRARALADLNLYELSYALDTHPEANKAPALQVV